MRAHRALTLVASGAVGSIEKGEMAEAQTPAVGGILGVASSRRRPLRVVARGARESGAELGLVAFGERVTVAAFGRACEDGGGMYGRQLERGAPACAARLSRRLAGWDK